MMCMDGYIQWSCGEHIGFYGKSLKCAMCVTRMTGEAEVHG